MKDKALELKDRALEEKAEKILSNMEEGFVKDFATITLLINDCIRTLGKHISELRDDVDKLIENNQKGVSK